MNPRHIGIALLALAGAFVPAAAVAAGLSVEVWTDRGRDAVYQPGQPLEVKVRTSRDAHLLVYEIDTEGYVRVLYPEAGRSGFVEGRATHRLPGPDSDFAWVVQDPVGQGYIVAIASAAPFEDLPWYLRPANRQAEEVGYYDIDQDRAEDEGVTTEGQIVGDPFVAMERIREAVVRDHDDDESFATAYTGYYVHHAVAYPRYLCYDCHRPNHWSWWSGFDPYYSSCSVFDVRVNWRWAWGPSYWFGHAPYFVYVYRADCPPYYRHWRGNWYSSWNGWRHWRSLWGPRITRRYKEPPPGYQGPRHGDVADRRGDRRMPPGFIPSPGVDDPPLRVARAHGRGNDPSPAVRTLRRDVGRGAADEPAVRTLRRGAGRGAADEPVVRTPRRDTGRGTAGPAVRSGDRTGTPRSFDRGDARDRREVRRAPAPATPRSSVTRPSVRRTAPAPKSGRSEVRSGGARKSVRAPEVKSAPPPSRETVKSTRGQDRGRQAPAAKSKSRGGGKRK